jgi:CheY-like chemotaxis protein
MGKLVFCEDDAMIQKLIRLALRSTGHEVHIAADGNEGIELVRRIRPDVIFSDVSMPQLDGFEMADRLKADPELRTIPIVFMTASVQRAQVDEALRRGGAGVLSKPFTMSELRERVEEFMRQPGR